MGARAASGALAAGLLAVACGGGTKAPVTPMGAVAPTGGPLAVEGAAAVGGDSYGGVVYGGEAYGGLAYGGITEPWVDPCGQPPGHAMIVEPTVPPDPPELAAYLPMTTPHASVPADATKTYSVPLHDSPSLGPAVAPVTLVTTFEFADPYSDRLRSTLVALSDRYGQDLRIVWKHFIVHRDRAQVAALAACAANLQGKFLPFMNAMFDASVAPGGNRRWDLGAVQTVATAVGLEPAKFDADLHSKRCKAEVIRDQALFEGIGQQAVPVSWINGRMLQGAQPVDGFVPLIDEELAKAQAALAKHVKLKAYYPSIVKKGRTKP